MTRIELQLSEDVVEAARIRAAQEGFPTVEAFASAVVQAELTASSDSLEQLLVNRLDDKQPTVEATPGFWEQIRVDIGNGSLSSDEPVP